MIAQFIVGLAKKSTSAADLIEKLRDTETLDMDEKVLSFAQELYSKVSRSNVLPYASSTQNESKLYALNQKRMN